MLGNIDSIDEDLTAGQLDNASHCHRQSRFACTRASHDPHFDARLDHECESSQDKLCRRSILKLDISELDLALIRPLSCSLC